MSHSLRYKASRILLVANWDWVIYNCRLPLAAALTRGGYEVVIVCPEGIYTDRIRSLGYQVEGWPLSRRSTNPVHEATALGRLRALYSRLKPGIVHHFTIKPNFYGSIVAVTLAECTPRVINTFTGLGYFFSEHRRATALRCALMPLLKLSLRRPTNWTVFQNPGDVDLFLRHRLARTDRIRLIPGSGVDTTRFQPSQSLHKRTAVVMTGARLIWDKGIADIVKAAQLLRARNVSVEFWIAGGADPGNLSAIPTRVLKSWEEQGFARFLGHRDDIHDLLTRADLALLPSYHEGLPRFLLEAAASGLPLIGTDIPGCRMIIRRGINGILVPIKAPEAIANAVANLLSHPDVMAEYGHASRHIAETEYSEQTIVTQYLNLYSDVTAVDLPRSA